MPQPYTTPNITTSEQIVEYANDVTNGMLMNAFLAVSVIILFLMLKSRFYKNSDSLALASFMTLILGSLFWAIGLVQANSLTYLLLLTIASAIWSLFE